MVTRDILRDWLTDVPEGTTHVIIVCDTFDNDDYPVYVKKNQDAREVAKKYNGVNMQKVMEVYSLTGTHTINQQLAVRRSFNYD